jgi:formylglycine-generating enzyme required for sulfatase activity
LPSDAAALISAVKCYGGSWTDAPGSNENLPINCIGWHTAQAFCTWDGGRLPTEAEWNYAAAGGSEQRVFPWGATVPGANVSLAVHGCYYYGTGTSCEPLLDIAPVGSVIAGNGKWGQSDLAGNLSEWSQDWYVDPYPVPCNDCAYLTSSVARLCRGGDYLYEAGTDVTTARRAGVNPSARGSRLGFRCARNR